MNIQSLKELLYTNLRWHPARIHTFYNLILAVLAVGSVRIKDMAQYLNVNGELKAKIVRIERWFLKQEINYTILGKIIVSLVSPMLRKVTIAIDRTNWQYGTKNINFFIASIVYGNISIPILWLLLEKKGSSNSEERIELLRKLKQILPVSRIENLIGDREFASLEVISYLKKHNFRYIFRIKKSDNLEDKFGKKIKLSHHFRNMAVGEVRETKGIYYNEAHNITCLQLEREQMFVVSDNKIGNEALGIYKQRWSIERAFKALKQSGFWIEETHMTDLKKLRKLMAILSIALAVAVLGGEIKNQIIAIKTKKHGRKQWSIFTYGLDWIVSAFINKSSIFLRTMLRLLSQRIANVVVL